MSLITEQVERLRKAADFRHTIGDYMTAGLHREAADTIEMLTAKLQAVNKKTMFSYFDGIADSMKEEEKELEAYQKAFEDIRAEIWDSGMNMTGEYQGVWVRYRDIEKILDKHNPDKGKERE